MALHRGIKGGEKRLKMVIRIMELIVSRLEMVFRIAKGHLYHSYFSSKIGKSKHCFAIYYQHLSKIIGNSVKMQSY